MPDTQPSGTYQPIGLTGDATRAFVPDPLPPTPPITLSGPIQDTYEKANRALGRLDGISALLPDTGLFIYLYVRKEAVLSSQIEGTQSSLSDLLLFELQEVPSVPIDDLQEVSNYVAALTHGLARIRDDGFPLSSRLIREIHAILMRGGRGSERNPGVFRTSQNWIGGTRPGNAHYVPPPHSYVPELMSNLEHFIHDTHERTPTLLKAALAHVQFESIHPFLDGNGRLGRLLITLLLCSENVLREPTLYLSLYFKTHRETYYSLLQQVRERSSWQAWLEYFLTGVYETAQQAFRSAEDILALFDRDRQRIEQGLGRGAGSALQVHQYLQRHALISVPRAMRELPLARPTIHRAVDALAEIGLLSEATGKQRNRLWFYRDYIDILNRGTEATDRSDP